MDLFYSLHHSRRFVLEQKLQGLQARPGQDIQIWHRIPGQSISPSETGTALYATYVRAQETFGSAIGYCCLLN